MVEFRKIASFRSIDEFRAYAGAVGADLPIPEASEALDPSPYKVPFRYTSGITGKTTELTNRWAVLPMEGWDCLADGAPSGTARRRWLRFAESGASLIFGCEAAAVMKEGKANTRQMTITPQTYEAIGALREEMVARHVSLFGDRPMVGLQLTHSGRFSKPNDDARLESRTAYEHPYLDPKFHCTPKNVLSDGEVEAIVEKFREAARLAYEAGFDFVDIKCAHGYLGHEFLSAHTRPGKYGGPFENRTRFFREIVEGIKQDVPGIDIAMRLSLGDMIPFAKGPDGVGEPTARHTSENPYLFAFGGDGTGLGFDFTEPAALVRLAHSLGIRMICATLGSPYYVPHIQRPAAFAVSDGYRPPEDPLLGAARQICAVRTMKSLCPECAFIASGMTYLQEYLPAVGGELLREEGADFVGIGRMVLSYPEICADSLAGKQLDRQKICRTFGDCTNAPRAGLISGCFPLDPFYKAHRDGTRLKEIKKRN